MTSEKQHLKFMNLAIELASSQLHREEGRPFGAVVIKDEQILGSGFNRSIIDNDPTAHAEIVAIRAACKKISSYRLDGCVLYTSCEPCPMCLSAVYWARIRTFYFGCTSEESEKFGIGDGLLYQEFQLKREQRRVESIQILTDDALSPFQEWIKKGGRATSLKDWR